jgi:diguanylate cyclase (GGDEF)-like protein
MELQTPVDQTQPNEQTPEEKITTLEQRIQELQEENAILKELSTKDPRTGLLNHRGLEEVTEILVSNNLRDMWDGEEGKRSLRVIYFDLNNLKKINDSYGHAAGDQLILDMAEYLKEVAKRPEDIVAKVGGDEFVLLLSNDERKKEKYLPDFKKHPNIKFSAGIVDVDLDQIYQQKVNELLIQLIQEDKETYGSIGKWLQGKIEQSKETDLNLEQIYRQVVTELKKTYQGTHDNIRERVIEEVKKTRHKADKIMYEAKKLGKDYTNILFENEIEESI